jgi:cytochrome c oxidase cbb3-type subunit 2
MIRSSFLVLGVLAAFVLGYIVLTVFPGLQLAAISPPDALRDYPPEAARGRAIYVREGCVYCHSQQVRAKDFGADFARGWGRASVPADYVFDKPHQIGTMRTGPDLMNIGARQPSRDWHLAHLYQPRAVTPGSIMPPFPWLFVEKAAAAPGDVVVPVAHGKTSVIVATQEALDLATYLLALDHSYDVRPAATATVAGGK